MTANLGTRPWPGTTPGTMRGTTRTAGRAAARPAVVARRRLSRPERAGRRVHPVGVLLAGILVAFLLGLAYLAQTIQLAATEYQIVQLQAQRDDLHRQVQTTETSVLRWGAESTVLERAQSLGLDQLPAGTRLIAR